MSLPDLVARYWPFLAPQRRALALAYAVSLGSVLAGMAAPWPLKFLIDDVLVAPPGPADGSALAPGTQVLLLAACVALLGALAAVLLSLDKVLHARVRERFAYAVRDTLMRRVYGLERGVRQASASGELTLRLTADVQIVGRLVCKTLPLLLKQIAIGAGGLIAIVLIDPGLGLVAALSVVGFVLVSRRHRVPLERAAKEKRRQDGRVAAFTQQSVRGIEHVQSMALEERTRRRYLDTVRDGLEAGVAEVRASVRLERASQVLAGVATACMAGVGGLQVLAGELSLGTLTVCLAYLAQLLKPVEKLNETAAALAGGIARARRLDALFTARQLDDDASGREIDAVSEIAFDAVSYRHPGAEACSVSGFRHVFRRGECTILTGASGSGKSTVLRLLLQLLKPDAGQVYVDGGPAAEIEPSSFRARCAVLQQDAHLFPGTLREILAELDPSAEEARLRAALAEVRLLDFVDSLPLGLETSIDEAGERLSGGQRSRLLLARALLADRDVLVLDEPFANIDRESARIIAGALRAHRRERILVIVTHEHELLALADHVIDAGRWQVSSPLSRCDAA